MDTSRAGTPAGSEFIHLVWVHRGLRLPTICHRGIVSIRCKAGAAEIRWSDHALCDGTGLAQNLIPLSSNHLNGPLFKREWFDLQRAWALTDAIVLLGFGEFHPGTMGGDSSAQVPGGQEPLGEGLYGRLRSRQVGSSGRFVKKALNPPVDRESCGCSLVHAAQILRHIGSTHSVRKSASAYSFLHVDIDFIDTAEFNIEDRDPLIRLPQRLHGLQRLLR